MKTQSIRVGDRDYIVNRLTMGVVREHGEDLEAIGKIASARFPDSRQVAAMCAVIHASTIRDATSVDDAIEFSRYVDSLEYGDAFPALMNAIGFILSGRNVEALAKDETLGEADSPESLGSKISTG